MTRNGRVVGLSLVTLFIVFAGGSVLGTGVRVVAVPYVTLYQGVLFPGEVDTYTGFENGCNLPVFSHSHVVLVVEANSPGDVLTLVTFNESGTVRTPTSGVVPHAAGDTVEGNEGCPTFSVEGSSVAIAASYAAIACKHVVGISPCPDPFLP